MHKLDVGSGTHTVIRILCWGRVAVREPEVPRSEAGWRGTWRTVTSRISRCSRHCGFKNL